MKTKTQNFLLLLLSVLAISPVLFISAAKAESKQSSSPFVEGVMVEEKVNSSSPQPRSYPYSQTFLISAYYSPLPGQTKYATGSYEADIRLNGEGVHAADGTKVYPGMIAAPSSYPFGTKMHIPGVGTVAVHDRGGAIVHSGERENVYDRLDVWMGYGDAGLTRALNWGKRTVKVTVYGINNAIKESVQLPGYSENERIIVEKPAQKSEPIPSRILFEKPDEPPAQVVQQNSTPKEKLFTGTLQLGDSGTAVSTLQKELQRVHLLGIEPTGYYGDVTAHAVFKFQQKHGLVSDKNSEGAGVFGPKTQNLLNNLIAQREEVQKMLK